VHKRGFSVCEKEISKESFKLIHREKEWVKENSAEKKLFKLSETTPSTRPPVLQ
jgi:hypothetical protein